ncbi:hypothetical protein [Microcoleus sp. Z1_B5]|uniref:hypothetical protein n=1 Tax=Microcoleus sp. Z1_B5 TaxID=3055430 RepID=UPI002FD1B7C7
MTYSKGAIALVDKFQKGDRLWLRKSKKGRSHFVTNSKRAIALFLRKSKKGRSLICAYKQGSRKIFP